MTSRDIGLNLGISDTSVIRFVKSLGFKNFTEFKERLFDKTSTLNHPWVIIDSDDKRISGLNAIRYVLKQIPYENKNEEVLNKEYPEVLTVLKPTDKPNTENNTK